MKRGIFCVMITCWATVAVAQQLYVSLGVGSRVTDRGTLFIDSMRLDLLNPVDEHYLVPGAGLTLETGQGWGADFNLRLQSGGTSLSVTEQPGSACTQCSVRKGLLISYQEIMIGAQIGYIFLRRGDLQLRLQAGLTWNYRFSMKQSPVKDLTWLSKDALMLLEQSSDMVKKNYWNTIVSIAIGWRKWTLELDLVTLLNDTVTENFTFKGNSHMIRTGQRIRVVSFKYHLLSI